MSYITFDQVCKDYGVGEQIVHAADHVTFGIEKGELCVVLGPSGAGKTTVLNLLGGMDKVTSGTIQVGDKIITGMRGPQLTEYRRLDVGFVFQFYNLMPSLAALLSRVSKTYNTTVVIITHNASIAPLGDRLIRMRNGGIQENAVNPHPAKVEDIAW